MKRIWVIGLILASFLASCTSALKDTGTEVAEHGRMAEGTSYTLASIDSLMWRQPDSALALLLPYFDTCCRDVACNVYPENSNDNSEDVARYVSTAYNRHYAHLLLSELLYKNDYAQTNRRDLQKAVNYFDSLVRQAPPLQRGLGGLNKPQSHNQNPNLAFLDARAHYINGVGYYERDSVVEACKEYLKALEVMEDRFEEKELVGHKAHFMALAYTRLIALLSDHYLHEQAIYFEKLALAYYHKYEAEPWHIAWILDEAGAHFDMMKEYDSSHYYYNIGLSVLPDTNNLTYRDISTHLAYLSYKEGGNSKNVLSRLKNLAIQAESVEETLARFAIIGEIFYREQMLDSALVYLNEVFQKSRIIDSKKQVAEWLVEINKAQGKESEIIVYAEYLVPFANKEENKSALKSQLTEMYNTFRQSELERKHLTTIQESTKKTLAIIGGLLVALMAVSFIYLMKKRKFDTQLEIERNLHKMNQEALGGRLKKSNEKLRLQMEETDSLSKTLENRQKKAIWSDLDVFLKEAICIEITTLLKDKLIKREAKSNDYPELHLSDTQFAQLRVAVERHFGGFSKMLTDRHPKISRDELNQCYLYLLDLKDTQIAALLSCDYSTVKKRSSKLKLKFDTEKDLHLFIKEFVL